MPALGPSKLSKSIERRLKGRVKWFNHAKGFGYITPEDGTHDILLDEAECANNKDPLKGVFHEGQYVEFDVRSNHRGQPVATNVNRINSASDGGDPPKAAPHRLGD